MAVMDATMDSPMTLQPTMSRRYPGTQSKKQKRPPKDILTQLSETTVCIREEYDPEKAGYSRITREKKASRPFLKLAVDQGIVAAKYCYGSYFINDGTFRYLKFSTENGSTD
jgi:hypothetical protein